MAEETDIIEELDTDIVKRTLVDSTAGGAELDIRTPYVIRQIPVPTRMRIPLYVAGELKSAEELAELGLTVREYTRLEVETAQYAAVYAANPTLAERVRQYAALLDAYGLAATATSDEISAAIMGDESKTDAEKTAAGAALLTLIHDIEINYQETGEPGLDAWAALPKLIKYLPAAAETPEQGA